MLVGMGRKLRRSIGGILLFLLALGLGLTNPVWANDKTEILWDSWGIPHIFAPNETQLMEAFGWAQAQNHGDLLLTLYGEARGKAAEYWGIDYLDNDQYVQTMDIPRRSEGWLNAQTPAMRSDLESFAQGINNYFQQHPDFSNGSLRQVLPITAQDVVAHVQRLLLFEFVTSPQTIASLARQIPEANVPIASNAWAIAPKKSQSGHTLLLTNPHLPWSGQFRLTEAQLVASGLDLTGAAFVGTPVPAMGFNNDLGWSLTVNYPHNVGKYALTLAEGGYEWDGEIKPFDRRINQVKILQGNGSYQTLQWETLESVAGIVVAQRGGNAYTIKIPGLDRSGTIGQFLQMGKAETLEQFEAAWQGQQIPMFNVLYGDRQGNIFYLYNALTPVREGNWQDWERLQPIKGSKDLNTDYYPYEQLPKLTNPASGWLQNTNDPPWTSTFPPELDPADYPPSLAAPDLGFAPSLLRTQRSIKLLENTASLTFEQFKQKVLNSQMELGDRIVPLLVSAAKALANPIGIEAAEVLQAWDKQANPDSRGAVLFMLWALTIGADNVLGGTWNPADPLHSPSGMADINKFMAVLEGVAAQVKFLYDDLAVSWGEVVQMQAGNFTAPANGAPSNLGSFRVLTLSTIANQRFQAVAGDTYLSLVEFADRPGAQSILVYGNASQPDSPHNGDQLELYSKNQLRPVWRSPKEIRAHLEKEEIL
ncbi:acylase [Synechocystis sp. CS-94]|nr:acylase [Synechocystis sp. CS-94]